MTRASSACVLFFLLFFVSAFGETKPESIEYFLHAILRCPVDCVWKTARDPVQMIIVTFGNDTGVHYINGGSANKIPSEYELVMNGSTVDEVMFERSDPEHWVTVAQVGINCPFLTWKSHYKVYEIDSEYSFILFTRKATLCPGVDREELLKELHEQDKEEQIRTKLAFDGMTCNRPVEAEPEEAESTKKESKKASKNNEKKSKTSKSKKNKEKPKKDEL